MILRNGKCSGKILRKIFWKIFHLTSLRTVTASELHNTISVDGCALRHELNQKDIFPAPKHCDHDFPSGQCLLNFLGFEGDRG
jgi:hypothetical protein